MEVEVVGMSSSLLHQNEASKWADANGRAVLEAAPDAILVVNRMGEVVAANLRAEKLYGYSREQLVGRVVESLIPARFRDRHRQHREKFLANPEKQAMQVVEIFAVHSDGSEIPVDVSLSPLTTESETFAISVIRDATKRVEAVELKRSEAVLRESEERLRLAVQAGKMYASEWDVATDVVVRSPEYRNIFGLTEPIRFTRQQFLGKLHPDDRAEFIAADAELTPENPTANITYRVLSGGAVIWLEKSTRGFFDGEGRLQRVVGMVANVTERKRGEEALRESEEKFRNVFRDAGVGMVVVSPEGRFLAANKVVCDRLGYTEEELLKKTVESVTFPEDWPAFSQKLGEILTEGRGFQCFEKRCLHKSGRIVYTESSASVIRSREGDPQYLVGHVLDITERREAEEAISAMTRKLIEAQEQERKRIGRELHDDINQRLAMLALELEQLQDNPAEVGSRLQELRKQTIEISNDVQALSHELHSSKLEYLGVVAGIKSWCREFGERQRMEVAFKSDVMSVLPLDVGVCFFRVLQEALHNAVKYSGAKRVEVQLAEYPNEVHLIVRDSGRGFEIEEARQGRGLGLTSMQERVRLVSGRISIESKPMGGTTIRVRVPVEFGHESQRAAG